MPKPPHRYGHVAWCYDALASAYSLGAIDRSKRRHHEWIIAGGRVLYAGAGTGREIVGACERGASVTCVEPCPAMAARLCRRLGRYATHVTIDPRPIDVIDEGERYDLVVAHYFLNLFAPPAMPIVLDRLCGLVRPGGRIVIADFKPSESDASIFDRALRSMYYRPVNLVGRALGICDLHPVYDYAPLLIERGLDACVLYPYRVLPGLAPLYHAVTATRPAGP